MKPVRLYTRNEKIQQYHTICRTLGMNREDKLALLSGWGANSSTELSDRELGDVLEQLRNIQYSRNEEANQWRRRVIAAAAAYFEFIGKFQQIDEPVRRLQYIKGMACRMTKHKSFNAIPVERLRNIYYALVKAKKDRMAIDAAVLEIQIESLTPKTQ
jgi:hypothetical protein